MATSSALRSLATVAALVVFAGCGSQGDPSADQTVAEPSGTTASQSPEKPRATPKAKPEAKPALEPAASSSSPKDKPAGKPAAITITYFTFSGAQTVAPGATIAVTNKDAAPHTMTADEGAFDVVVKGDGTATFQAPTKPGRYSYTCEYHPSMKGVLVVK